MSWLVDWDGTTYDVDPTEFTALEMSAIKQRAGLTFQQLLQRLVEFDGDAIRAVFWTVERRASPDLKFSEYAGPPVRVIMSQIGGLVAVIDQVGKALPASGSSTSAGSASSTD